VSELDPELERRLGPMRREPVPSASRLASLRTALRGELARRRNPRRIVLAPGSAIAAVAAVVALTSLVWWSAGRLRPALSASATPTQFVLRASGAHSVSVVGDFNNWDPQATPLAETGDGVWSVIVPLQPGTIRFSFLIDGREWRADPNSPPAPLDFGRPTSLAFVPARGAGP
jgi:Glycogen recognition site of AMP-activated protein kinase